MTIEAGRKYVRLEIKDRIGRLQKFGLYGPVIRSKIPGNFVSSVTPSLRREEMTSKVKPISVGSFSEIATNY